MHTPESGLCTPFGGHAPPRLGSVPLGSQPGPTTCPSHRTAQTVGRFVTISISSDSVPAVDRERALHDTIYDSVVRVDITHEQDRRPTEIDFELQLSKLGNIVMFSARSSPITVDRTPRLTQDDAEPEIVVGLQVAGTSAMVQNGRYAVLRAGEFAIWDTTVPYTLMFDHGVNQHFFRLPRAALALPESSLSELSAVTLGREKPIARFVASYLARMAAHEELRSRGQRSTCSAECFQANWMTRKSANRPLRPLLS
jgi:hypothetical protein